MQVAAVGDSSAELASRQLHALRIIIECRLERAWHGIDMSCRAAEHSESRITHLGVPSAVARSAARCERPLGAMAGPLRCVGAVYLQPAVKF